MIHVLLTKNRGFSLNTSCPKIGAFWKKPFNNIFIISKKNDFFSANYFYPSKTTPN